MMDLEGKGKQLQQVVAQSLILLCNDAKNKVTLYLMYIVIVLPYNGLDNSMAESGIS